LLITRIITGAIFGIGLVLALWLLPTWGLGIVVGLLWIAGAWEWAAFARLQGGLAVAYVAAFIAAMAGSYAGGTDAAALLLALALLWWMVALLALLTYPHKFSPTAAATAGYAVLLPSWVLLVALRGSGTLGPGLAMTSIAIVWAADVGAYTFGRSFGRVKLAPAVSPGKTWEGAAGGLLCAGLVGCGSAYWLGLPAGRSIVLAIATALVSIVGDLTVSMFKRNVGLKDSGKLLPGHGGVLDRIDSLTAAIPVFALGAQLSGWLD
jgi:phosphatidate cytidylyltransferase